MLKPIKEFPGITVTFLTTEQCNLRCKYCYEINKKSKHMTIDVAKKAIDQIVKGLVVRKDNQDLAEQGIIIEFIGGDSLVNPELLDQILDYWVYKVNTCNSKWAKIWRNRWRVSLCSNGTLFSDKKVRDFCEKWRDVMCLSVSIDGCPEIHDMNRVFPDGRGSMPEIMKYWDWFQNTSLAAKQTKATAAKSTIPYLYDSLVFMHETLKLDYIHQNFIMEPTGCTEEDYKLLKEQLEKCSDYVFEHRNEIYWSMMGTEFADHKNSIDECVNRCGSGQMTTIGIDGKIYPCMRWLPVSLGDNRPDMSIGHINKGGLTRKGKKLAHEIFEGSKNCNNTKDEECKKCEYESACAYCIAGCFTEYGEFKRYKHICEITKVTCEVAKKYKQREIDADGVYVG